MGRAEEPQVRILPKLSKKNLPDFFVYLTGPTSNASSTPRRHSAIASPPTPQDASRSMGKNLLFIILQ